MNNIPVRITFKGCEEFGKVVAVPVVYDHCFGINNKVHDCVFVDSSICPKESGKCNCHKIVFVKYEVKW